MSEYQTTDFDESLGDIKPDEIAHVHAAWGESTEGYGEWSGGFLIEMKTGAFVYVTGWCDTSGWGCRDGRDEEWFPQKPDLTALSRTAGERPNAARHGSDPVRADEWDLDPADLNRWITNPDRDRWSFS